MSCSLELEPFGKMMMMMRLCTLNTSIPLSSCYPLRLIGSRFVLQVDRKVVSHSEEQVQGTEKERTELVSVQSNKWNGIGD